MSPITIHFQHMIGTWTANLQAALQNDMELGGTDIAPMSI